MRPPEDDWVDRLDVEAQQCVELTNTNKSIDLITLFFIIVMILKSKGCDNDGAKWEKRHETCEILWSSVNFYLVNTSLASTGKIFSLGGNREGEIPDPIPNSEVKPFIADGTVLKSMEE